MILKQQQQQSAPLPSQFNYSEFNFDVLPSNDHHQQTSSSSPISDNHSSSLSQDINNYYSNVPIDRMTPSPLKNNHIKSNKNIKTGNSN